MLGRGSEKPRTKHDRKGTATAHETGKDPAVTNDMGSGNVVGNAIDPGPEGTADGGRDSRDRSAYYLPPGPRRSAMGMLAVSLMTFA
jgi:hypothetical protein